MIGGEGLGKQKMQKEVWMGSRNWDLSQADEGGLC